MNYKPLIKLIANFLSNMAVASFAVALFQGVWHGAIAGLLFLLGAIVLITRGGD